MAVKGMLIGGHGSLEVERGEPAPRVFVSFWCASGHETRPGFSADAPIPETWECTRCGGPAGQDKGNPPARPHEGPMKTHLQYVRERRSDADGAAILAEALARLHGAAPAERDAGRPEAPAPGPRPPAGRPGASGARPSPRAATPRRPIRRPASGTATRPEAKVHAPSDPSTRGEPQSSAAAAPKAGTEEEHCGRCQYRRTARGHKVLCLGEE